MATNTLRVPGDLSVFGHCSCRLCVDCSQICTKGL